MSVIQKAAQEYLDAGWDLVRIKAGEKQPAGKWIAAHPKAHEFEDGDAIAGKCGTPSQGRVCVDADSKEAIILLPEFISASNAHIEGRPSKPNSHWWVLDPEGVTRRYKDVDRTPILEVLSTGSYAVLPPSGHPSGEFRAWVEPRPTNLTAYDTSTLSYLAVTALLTRHWPTGHGSRHDLAGPLAGLLLRCKVNPRFVPHIIRLAADVAKDNQVNDRVKYAEDSVAKFAAGDRITGGPKVAEILGLDVKSRICSLLGSSDFGVVDALNQRWFVVDVGAETVVGEELTETNDEKTRSWSRFEFRSFKAFRDRLIKEPDVVVGEKSNGDPMLQSRADYWLEHEEGRQYDRLVYSPDGKGVDESKTPPDLNGWKGFSVNPAPGVWTLTKSFIKDIICNGDDGLFGWLMDWCADLVQHPGDHADTSPVLTGPQGAGKNFFFDKVLGWCFNGRHVATVTNLNGVLGDFNDRLAGLVLLVLDEVNMTEQQSIAMRGLVTADVLDINRKHIARARERSMLHIGCLSNDNAPIRINQDDRRFAFFKVSGAHANDHAYFASLMEELDQRGGRAAMLHELLHRQYDRNALRLAPLTAAKKEVKAASLTPQKNAIRHWLLKEQHVGALEVAREELFNELRGAKHQPDDTGWSNDSLGRVIKDICPHLPVNTKRRVNGKERRSYQFGLVSEAREQFDAALGIETDWPTNKLDDLVTLAARETIGVNENVKDIEGMGWSLLHLATTVLRKVGVSTDALERAEDEVRGTTHASTPF